MTGPNHITIRRYGDMAEKDDTTKQAQEPLDISGLSPEIQTTLRRLVAFSRTQEGKEAARKLERPAEEPRKELGPGPQTMSRVQEKLGTIIALAFLGKRAYMDGDYDLAGWHHYFREVRCPLGQYGDLDDLAEMAFDGLLRIAAEVWQELDDPKDAVEGEVIDRIRPRTKPEPEGGE
jgi:hypothetical protein